MRLLDTFGFNAAFANLQILEIRALTIWTHRGAFPVLCAPWCHHGLRWFRLKYFNKLQQWKVEWWSCSVRCEVSSIPSIPSEFIMNLLHWPILLCPCYCRCLRRIFWCFSTFRSLLWALGPCFDVALAPAPCCAHRRGKSEETAPCHLDPWSKAP